MSTKKQSSPTTGNSSKNTASRRDDRGIWPVYSGESFNLWNPDTGIYYDSVGAMVIASHLYDKAVKSKKLARSAWSEVPSESLSEASEHPCHHARVAFRDVTRSTDTRTLVAALVPPRRVICGQAPTLLQTAGNKTDEAFVLGVLSSMICDWQARRIAELHIKFAHLNNLSIPDPGAGHAIRDRVVEITGRLAARDDRFAEWASSIGVECGPLSPESQESLLAELDACVAVLYGLTPDDVTVLYDTFGREGQWDTRRDTVKSHLACLYDGSEP